MSCSLEHKYRNESIHKSVTTTELCEANAEYLVLFALGNCVLSAIEEISAKRVFENVANKMDAILRKKV